MKSSSIRISQCMIVKNEEKNLEKALFWGKGVVYEQIVVDTGSTDGTVELAKSMGAKVYHFEWIDDFAAAKNYAISKAEGDWIAFLDADEFMTKEWTGKLLSKLEQVSRDGYLALRSPWVCIDETGAITAAARHCRFFVNKPGMNYMGAIHEALRYNGMLLPEERIADADADFPVYHTGYQAQEWEGKKKNQRNTRILEKELKKHPQDYNVMGYLGDAYRAEEKHEEAIAWYRKAVTLMPEEIAVQDERSALTFVRLLVSLTQQNRDEREVLEAYELARRKVPWVYDIDHILGSYYWERKVYEKTAFHLERALRVAEEYGKSAYGIYMTKDIAGIWGVLAVCYQQTGETEKALRYCVTLLKTDKRQFNSLVILLTLLEGEKPEDTLAFLGNMYDIRQPSDRIFLLRAALRVNAERILALLRKECSEEELEYLERLNH